MANLNQATTLVDPKSVITPQVRLSFPALVKPRAFEGGEPKFQATLIVPKEADITALKLAAKIAAEEKWGTRIPANLRLPFRDGAERVITKDDGSTVYADGYGPGVLFINTSAKTAPQLVDRQLIPVTGEKAEQLFYAGCYVRCFLRAFAYDAKGNRGVSFGLNAVQWVADGDSLGSRIAAQQAFSALGPMPEETGGSVAADPFASASGTTSADALFG